MDSMSTTHIHIVKKITYIILIWKRKIKQMWLKKKKVYIQGIWVEIQTFKSIFATSLRV